MRRILPSNLSGFAFFVFSTGNPGCWVVLKQSVSSPSHRVNWWSLTRIGIVPAFSSWFSKTVQVVRLPLCIRRG